MNSIWKLSNNEIWSQREQKSNNQAKTICMKDDEWRNFRYNKFHANGKLIENKSWITNMMGIRCHYIYAYGNWLSAFGITIVYSSLYTTQVSFSYYSDVRYLCFMRLAFRYNVKPTRCSNQPRANTNTSAHLLHSARSSFTRI